MANLPEPLIGSRSPAQLPPTARSPVYASRPPNLIYLCSLQRVLVPSEKLHRNTNVRFADLHVYWLRLQRRDSEDEHNGHGLYLHTQLRMHLPKFGTRFVFLTSYSDSNLNSPHAIESLWGAIAVPQIVLGWAVQVLNLFTSLTGDKSVHFAPIVLSCLLVALLHCRGCATTSEHLFT